MIAVTAWVPARQVPTGYTFNDEMETRTVGGRFIEMYIPRAQIRAIEGCIDPQHKDCLAQIVFADNTAVQVKEPADHLAADFDYEEEFAQVRFTLAEWTNKEMRDD